MQNALRVLYPHQCLSCHRMVESALALCGACWRDTPFIGGVQCCKCGAGLPGEDDGSEVLCDDCMRTARPWRRGSAVLSYADNARRLVLALKHGDRQDIVTPAAGWMAEAARPMVTSQTLVIPVPVHWTRLVSRRFNQSALLARAVARQLGVGFFPDALIRPKRTPAQDGMTAEQRFANLRAAIRPHPRRGMRLGGRPVLIVDDVMTSGATFAATTEACHAAGARDVCVIALARVTKDA